MSSVFSEAAIKKVSEQERYDLSPGTGIIGREGGAVSGTGSDFTFDSPRHRLLVGHVFGYINKGGGERGLRAAGGLPHKIHSHGPGARGIQIFRVLDEFVFLRPGKNGLPLRAGYLYVVIHSIGAVEEGEDMRDGADVIGAKGSLRFSLGEIGFGCPFYAVCIGGGVRNVGKGVKGVLGRGLLIRFVDVNKKLFSIYSRANG